MKSRIAMTAMLVTGLLMSGTGAGLAVSGIDAVNNASSAQYPVGTPVPTPPPTQPIAPPDDSGTLPTSTQSVPKCDENGDNLISPSEAAKNGCGEVASETDEGTEPETTTSTPTTPSDSEPATTREEAAQPSRQVAASGNDELPFTGFAAIPILAGGMALLAGGLVLRRRTA